jgi:hypothetical protein
MLLAAATATAVLATCQPEVQQQLGSLQVT